MPNIPVRATNGSATYESLSTADGSYDLGGLPSGLWTVKLGKTPTWRQTDPTGDYTVYITSGTQLDLRFGLARLPAVYVPFVLKGGE